MRNEVASLTSLDLALLVAQPELAEKLLARVGGGNDTNRAGLLIRQGLHVQVPKRSQVLTVTFRHRDPTTVQPTLARVCAVYIQRNAEIWEGVGVMDSTFQFRRDEFRSKMLEAESRLNQLRTNHHGCGIDESIEFSLRRLRENEERIGLTEIELAGVRAKAATETPSSGVVPTEVAVLEARLKAMRSAQADLHTRLVQLTSTKPEVLRLERERDVAEAGFRYYTAALDRVNRRWSESSPPGRIAVIQRPTPPAMEPRRVPRKLALALAGGLVLGILLSCLLEVLHPPSAKANGVASK